MNRSLLLGIDVGTSATKLVLLDAVRGIVADLTEPAGYTSAHPGWAEADPEGWWRNVCAGVPRLIAAAGRAATEIAAVGVAGMVPTIILVDGSGNVLRPSIQQNDARAASEIAWFRERTVAADILHRTGSPITQQSVGPKLRWLRAHESTVMRAARHLCGSYDFLVHRLTGVWSAERNWALESGLYDLTGGDWDTELLALAQAPRSWLGPVRSPADIVGGVSAGAAAQTGLVAGTPVVAGSADHVASAFAAGVINPGDLLVKLGGSGDILYCTAEPRVDPRLFLDFHLVNDRFLPNGCMAASGSLLVWFRTQLAAGLTFEALDAEATPIPAGADGLLLLPYFLGEKTPLFDPFARGTIVGLSLSHTRGHLFRAILEGIGFAFRNHLEVLSAAGASPQRARCTNGGAGSALWRQVTADVLGLPLERVAGHPGSSLGAAFVAGKGVGLFASWAEMDRFTAIAETVEPNPSAHAIYNEMYPLFRETYDRLKDLYPRLQTASAVATA